jgi:exo-rhamnogalacturonan lyase-like protein
MDRSTDISLIVEERAGIERVDEPVTVGLPFPRGVVSDSALLTLWDARGGQLFLQAQPLSHWSDGSVRWMLLDFQASVNENARACYQIQTGSGRRKECRAPSLSVRESTSQIVIDTGKATFFLNRRLCKPFDRVRLAGEDFIAEEGSSFVLTDDRGRECVPYVHDCVIETIGPLRATVRARGELKAGSGFGLARFVARLSFYAGSGLVAMQVTLHNPRAARHPGGLWDLGDEGSIYFTDLTVHVPLRTDSDPHVSWTTQPHQVEKQHSVGRLEIYQDSSGGENWRSANHVNRFGQLKQSFQGYRVSAWDSFVEQGLRATPIIAVLGESGGVAATIEKFWQNCPKAMEANGNELVLRLFPRQHNDLFELQGGEQKTHTLYLQFNGPKEEANLAWVHDRLMPRAAPEDYAESKACSYVAPLEQDENAECRALLASAISGPQSFFARREMIDEYGWRHFGDLYADHEAIGRTGALPVIAHYNNQYDVIYGAIVEYLRGGDRRWFELAADLARHVIDIDIYHTENDRPAYNGGLFWHTDHYLDAGTATHRTYSKTSLNVRDPRCYGGGPSNEHNYTSGLLHHYYLTGDETAREAVLSLADWVINMDDGARRPLGWIDPRPTGLASATANRDYHGPGRGAANSINALLDAHVLTGEKGYFAKAEQLVRRCIHPRDDIEKRNLDDPEHRWSYLVFLQALGKYLDAKIEKGEIDDMYGYAQASLLHYAEWMLEHEVPYATVLHKVAIPTETWPAQDIRKSVVFHLAAEHATGLKHAAFREKAALFFEACIRDLRAFPTCTLTRPLVLLLTNAYAHAYFQLHPEDSAPRASEKLELGAPIRFRPQFSEVTGARGKIADAWRILKHAVRCMSRVVRKGQILLGAHHG